MLNEISLQNQYKQSVQDRASKHISTKSMNAFVAMTHQKKSNAAV